MSSSIHLPAIESDQYDSIAFKGGYAYPPAPLLNSKFEMSIPERRDLMKHARMIVTVAVLIAGLVGSGVLLTFAQDTSVDNMQIVREKVQADKKLLVAANMELTESEAKAFWPVYEKYQDELFLLRARTVKLISDYADSYEKMSNEKAKKLLEELIVIEALGPKLRQAYLPKFRKVLPEIKVVRYYQIENKINAALNYEIAANIPLIKAAQ